VGSSPLLDLGRGQSTCRIHRQSLCDNGRSCGMIRGVCVVLWTV
jgi:hypothetical protein